MELEVLSAHGVVAREVEVVRIVAETAQGSFGLLPRRLDCVAALVPGILTFETRSGGEKFMAVDDGILVKTGQQVRVSVRRALAGSDLAHLRETVHREFMTLAEEARSQRSVLAKLETGFLGRLAALRHD